MAETTNIHGTDEGNLTVVLPEPLLIKMGIGWTRNAKDRTKLTSARPMDYVAEIERLREALNDLIIAATCEVNEKGAGGFLLARLSDAKSVLPPNYWSDHDII